ncbi:MAG: hypothetical protein EOP73_02530 [Variovorax sp.]|jgi:SEC-C motif-containing protein|nr:MAG: hypothetical protein EOP73_02530 [Variovorax sp.]
MSSPTPPTNGPCPCGKTDRRDRPFAYALCCGRYVDDFDGTPAPDAESLMRSRYSAFVFQRADYLLATWHASTRPASVEFEPDVKWLGLDVRSRSVLDAEHAEVEFVARQRSAAGVATRLHERSRFVREGEEGQEGGSRWYYLDGERR